MNLHIDVQGDPQGLSDISCALSAVLERRGIEKAIIDDVMLITEEVLANAIDHGFVGLAPGEGRLGVSISAEDGCLRLEFRDNGIAFNPLDQAEPDLDADILDRPIGGLGVHLIRELSQNVYYRRDGQCNVLGLTMATHQEQR